jgi:hypothetical protein
VAHPRPAPSSVSAPAAARSRITLERPPLNPTPLSSPPSHPSTLMFVAKFYDGVVPAPHPEKGQAEVAELGALVDAKVGGWGGLGG